MQVLWLIPAQRSKKFFDTQQRLPKRQNPDTDEQRAEDTLARRWDRLLAQRASLGDALLTTYERLFMAADMEDTSVVVDTCAAVEKFFDTQQRLPKRQNPATDEQRANDTLARRWDRLLAQRASLGDALLTTYERLFMAADMEDTSVLVDTCAAVEKFFDTQPRLPKRQNPATDEQRADDTLARRWDRLLAQRASLGDALLTTYERLFMAADKEDASVLVDTCTAVEKFFDTQQRLPKRQNPATDEQRAEDTLARRWDRLLAQRASLGDALLTTYERLFMAADIEGASVVVDTCAAVVKFFDTQQRLPQRQNPATNEQRTEDALAQRWDRLLAQRAWLPNEIQERHRDLFDSADMADTDAIFALCSSVQHFFNSAGRLPRRQAVNDEQQHEEDCLARRWHRLLERHDWLQVAKSPRLEAELLQVVQCPQSEELRRMLTDLLTVQHRDDVLRGRVSPHTCVDNLLRCKTVSICRIDRILCCITFQEHFKTVWRRRGAHPTASTFLRGRAEDVAFAWSERTRGRAGSIMASLAVTSAHVGPSFERFLFRLVHCMVRKGALGSCPHSRFPPVFQR